MKEWRLGKRVVVSDLVLCYRQRGEYWGMMLGKLSVLQVSEQT